MKCPKKRDARDKFLFCQSKPVAFLPFSLPSPSLLLKLPSKTTSSTTSQTALSPYSDRFEEHSQHPFSFSLTILQTTFHQSHGQFYTVYDLLPVSTSPLREYFLIIFLAGVFNNLLVV